MTKSKLAGEIKQIKKSLEDTGLPSDVRAALEKALKKAESMLESGQYDQPKPKSKKENTYVHPEAAKSNAWIAFLEKKGYGSDAGKRWYLSNTPIARYEEAGSKRISRKEYARLEAEFEKSFEKSPLEDCQEILRKHRASQKKDEQRRSKRERAGKPPELTVVETVGKAAKAVAGKVKKKVKADKSLTKTESEAAQKKIMDLVESILQGMGSHLERLKFITDLHTKLRLRSGKLAVNGKKAAAGAHVEGGMRSGQLRIFHYKTQHFDICPDAKVYFERLLANPESEGHQTIVIAMAKDVDEMLGKVKEAGTSDQVDREFFVAAAGHLMRAMYWSYGMVESIEGKSADPHKWYPGFLAGELYQVAEKTAKPGGHQTMADGGIALKIDNSGDFPVGHDPALNHLDQQDLDKINTVLSTELDGSDTDVREILDENGIPEPVALHVVTVWRDAFLRFSGFQLTKTSAKKAKGGKVKFKDKVKAVEKELEGKPVPKKFQKESGKQYTKKTATEAARKIIGAQNKKKKKYLLGGIAIHSPASISLLGDRDNLLIHDSI